ncbi:DUF6730 family protein [Changchengzhania lutea]|uniref:DUF6730 family protein n=1 Tax=Changchengzhania lutea TaxID=2049305 RepID=UPI00115D2F3A|nr:DUF6730 family protein [Changchengzhania lutea]
MTKLEELSALMVNEINDFKNGLEKLEQINTQLKDTKIKMDLKEYRIMTESHQQKMASHLYKMERIEDRIDSKLKEAKIYPNWVVVVFIVSLLFGVVSVSYILLK